MFDWGNYVLCGIKGVLDLAGGHDQATPGFDLVVDGRVPQGAGLSSSSSLVCCSALAVAACGKAVPGRLALAELCARSERYVGTEGGGMDQAAAFLSTAGAAKLIAFHPLRASPVPLPPRTVVVVANSLVAAHKYVTAGSCFNKRVAECRLAARVIAHKTLSKDAAAQIRTLGQLQLALGVSVAAMAGIVDEHLRPGAYLQEELCAALGDLPRGGLM